MSQISFPRQYARTRRFSLGTPRGIAIAPDGRRILFLRSKSGSDAMTCLYELDVTTGSERLVVDPEPLLAGGLEHLAPEAPDLGPQVGVLLLHRAVVDRTGEEAPDRTYDRVHAALDRGERVMSRALER